MCKIEQLITNLNSVQLPSKQWASHIASNNEYLAIVNISLTNHKLHIHKAVVLTSADGFLKTTLFLNGDIIHIPNHKCDINSSEELIETVQRLHNLKKCAKGDSPDVLNCDKYFQGAGKYCTTCANEPKVVYEPNYTEFESFANTNVNETTYRQSHECKFCDETFHTKTQLKTHTKVHTGVKPYSCSVCNKKSSQRSDHVRHVMTHSNKANLCSICGKTFAPSYRIKDHMLTHAAEKPYECSVCKKLFAKNYNLKLHEKTHTGERPYICSMCGKTYTTRSNLSTHTMSVHNDKKPYACAACDKRFVHPRLLRIHMRRHTGEKPYKCRVCDKTFAKNSHLTVHNRLHSGERPYVCEFCHKGFTTTGNLSTHKRVHHKNDGVT